MPWVGPGRAQVISGLLVGKEKSLAPPVPQHHVHQRAEFVSFTYEHVMDMADITKP